MTADGAAAQKRAGVGLTCDLHQTAAAAKVRVVRAEERCGHSR
jgi:hypothetical protein